MTQLLDDATLAVIKESIKDVMDTFATADIQIKHNPDTTTTNFGEGHVHNNQQVFHLKAFVEYTKAAAGRYITVQSTDMGQREHDGWRIYLWKDDVDNAVDSTGHVHGLQIDPEADKVFVPLMGKEYEIRFFSPSALFSNLGFLMYELDIHFDGG